MKRTLFFSLFLAFVACKNAETQQPITISKVLPDTSVKELFVKDDSPTNSVEPYTRVKKGQVEALAQCLAKYHMENFEKRHIEKEGIESKKLIFKGWTKNIKDHTIMEPHGDDPPTPTAQLEFELYNNEIYMHYFTNTLYHTIPIDLVKQYLE